MPQTLDGVQQRIALDGFAVIRDLRHPYTEKTISYHPVVLVLTETHVSGYWPHPKRANNSGDSFRVKHDGKRFRFGNNGVHAGTYCFEDVVPQPFQKQNG